MCGLVGFFTGKAELSDRLKVLARRMVETLRHRGPDDTGLWLESDYGLALAHQRLSILDLTEAGHQPMISPSGRFVLVFNGEIYNHEVLRSDLNISVLAGTYGSLAKLSWRGHSDTETLAAGFDKWGIMSTIERTVGMFAFAVWDRQKHLLTLGRDRMGEKPLYYGQHGGVFLFASELKALRAHPRFCTEIDRNSLALLLRHSYIPAPYSIYKGIKKLEPGCLLTVNYDTSKSHFQSEIVSYWQLNEVVSRGLGDRFIGTDGEATNLLDTQLRTSISMQMHADVPLGVLLSGGVDSSSVAALMQQQSRERIRTFSIGFDEKGFDEAKQALAVAKHLGTEHTELYVMPNDVIDLIPRLPSIYCEPFSDSSQLPTFLVCQLARRQVVVALSGDGGDELFGGYNRYVNAHFVWSHLQRFPMVGRRIAATALLSLAPQTWDYVYRTIESIVPKRFSMSAPGEKAHKLAAVLKLSDEKAFYHRVISNWNDPASVVLGANEPKTSIADSHTWPKSLNFVEWMMALDAQSYLPDDILTKVDRAAMANSLEVRVPFLDHRIVELAWRLPLKYKIRNGQSKWLLRQVLYQYVPKDLIERPKTGFSVPLDIWLRGPLREWAEDLLSESRLTVEGYFDPSQIRQKWREHLSGRRNWQHQLWSILMFQAWQIANGPS